MYAYILPLSLLHSHTVAVGSLPPFGKWKLNVSKIVFRAIEKRSTLKLLCSSFSFLPLAFSSDSCCCCCCPLWQQLCEWDSQIIFYFNFISFTYFPFGSIQIQLRANDGNFRRHTQKFPRILGQVSGEKVKKLNGNQNFCHLISPGRQQKSNSKSRHR